MGIGQAGEGDEVPSWLSDLSFTPWGLSCWWTDRVSAYSWRSAIMGHVGLVFLYSIHVSFGALFAFIVQMGISSWYIWDWRLALLCLEINAFASVLVQVQLHFLLDIQSLCAVSYIRSPSARPPIINKDKAGMIKKRHIFLFKFQLRPSVSSAVYPGVAAENIFLTSLTPKCTVLQLFLCIQGNLSGSKKNNTNIVFVSLLGRRKLKSQQ